MSATIPQFGSADKAEEIATALSRDGAAIVTHVVAPEVVDQLNALIQPVFDRQVPGGGAFMGNRHKGLGRLFARGSEFSEYLLLNPLILDVADAILLPEIKMGALGADDSAAKSNKPAAWSGADALSDYFNQGGDLHCHHYKVNVSGATEIWGGGAHQPFHRENDIFRPFIPHDPAQPEYILFIVVAGTDFRVENGATRLVLGSHTWPKERKAEESEVSQAVMSKGSVVFWLGKVLHGLGASLEDAPRKAFTYSLVVDWLATEENQYVATPLEVAQMLPAPAQQLLGYRASPTLGWVSGRDLNNVLDRPS